MIHDSSARSARAYLCLKTCQIMYGNTSLKKSQFDIFVTILVITNMVVPLQLVLL